MQTAVEGGGDRAWVGGWISSADSIADWSAVAALISLAMIVVAVTCDALGRYFFSSPIQGVQAYVEGLLQPTVAFFGASLVARDDGHIRVELLRFDRSPRLRRWRACSFRLVISSFWGACSYLALARAWEAYAQGRWPVGEIAVPTVVSFGVTGLGCALAAYAHLFAPRSPAERFSH